mmetsp:Transcript_70754/g.152435  ORF Transcript_70754/g.152435 Transcript_70754/m.152435 type:complete len:80 (+) Transcript_70754:49-288(+)
MVIFIFAGPVGTVIGFIVAHDAPEVMSAIFSSLTAGTFLYISMTEVVSLEFAKVEHKMLKVFGLVLGISSFACLVMMRD